MHRRILGLRLLGIVLLALGFLIVIFVLKEHNTYKDEMKNLLDGRVIIKPSNENMNVESPTSTLIDTSNLSIIEGLGEDQSVEIKEGTPIISIPSLNILAPIINGTDDYSLKLGAGKFSSSVNMGEKGNFSLAGHSSTIYNQIFNGLENIKLLDKIECYNELGTSYNYYVTDKFKVEPSDTWVVNQTEDSRLTLVTCTDGGIRRFIVVAKLMSDSEFEEYKLFLKREQVLDAITIVDSNLDIDISAYLQEKNHIRKVYRSVLYPFSLVQEKDKKQIQDISQENPHILDTDFKHSIGFAFNIGGD